MPYVPHRLLPVAVAAVAWGAGSVFGQVQEAKLTPSDGESRDQFGTAPVLRGDLAVIGAYQDDDFGNSSGSAYVFERVNGEWIQTTKLLASDGDGGDSFGGGIAVGDGVVFVTALFDDDNGDNSGSLYIFESHGGNWLEAGKLTAPDGEAMDYFGSSPAISGDTLFVGARGDDDAAVDAGAVYAFERVGGEWTFRQKLLASDGQDGDQFGHAITFDSDTLMVASLSDDDLGTDAGAVYVFERVANQWIQSAKLHASDGEAGDSFGYSIAVMGDTAVIGARREGNAGESWLGAAYVFERFGGVWSQSARLTASDRSPLDNFGNSVSLGDGVIVVGAHQNDYAGSNAGSAYVYLRPAGGWEHATEDVRLIGDDTDLADNFGQYVCVDGTKVICGANDADPAGAAYVFDLTELLPCRTDLNGDGVLDTRDFLEYLNLWTSGDPRSDWNGDGTVNTQDFLAYLNDWAAGC